MNEQTQIEKVKQTAASLENIFQVIQNSTHLGSSVNAVGQALNFISAMYAGVTAEIEKLEAEEKGKVEATAKTAESDKVPETKSSRKSRKNVQLQ